MESNSFIYRNHVQKTLSKPFVLVIEGLISCGKTTIINDCLVPLLTERGWKVTVIKEPVYLWGEILPLFYGDQKRWAYTFQTKAFHDRVLEYQDVWNKYQQTDEKRGHIFISERSIISDTIFVETLYKQGNMTELERKLYYEWWRLWSQLISFDPDLFVYLSPSIEETMRRVKMRARPGEEGVSLEYQLLLKKYHDEVFGEDKLNVRWVDELQLKKLTTPVYTLENDMDFKNDIVVKNTVVDIIEKLIIETQFSMMLAQCDTILKTTQPFKCGDDVIRIGK